MYALFSSILIYLCSVGEILQYVRVSAREVARHNF